MLTIGSTVKYTDPKGVEHPALVTHIWGPAEEQPLINLVYVSSDADRTDTYGRQIERETSVSHQSKVPGVPGRFWQE